MRRAMKSLLLAAAVALVCAPAQARADGFFSPWVGSNWASNGNNGRAAVGVSAGAMGAGVIGGEFDLGYSPNAFGTDNDFGQLTMFTAMGNVIVGIPVGGQHGGGIRPFLSGGAGLIRVQPNGGSLLDSTPSDNNLGWNLGAGLMGYFNNHVGLRGDLRYFRATDDNGIPGNEPKFWRGAIGVVFR